MTNQTQQIIFKLNASENNTIKQQKQFEQQLHQLNETLLHSESDYQIKINNLNQQTRKLETIVLGSFMAFGILSFVLLITCIRNATN